MVLDPMDELMEREEDMVGTYDHGLDTPSSTVPPIQGGFLLYRPSKADFEEILKLTKEGEWGGNGWKDSGIGYCCGGVGPDGLLSYFYHKEGLKHNLQKKSMRDGSKGQPVEGVRFFAADRQEY